MLKFRARFCTHCRYWPKDQVEVGLNRPRDSERVGAKGEMAIEPKEMLRRVSCVLQRLASGLWIGENGGQGLCTALRRGVGQMIVVM